MKDIIKFAVFSATLYCMGIATAYFGLPNYADRAKFYRAGWQAAYRAGWQDAWVDMMGRVQEYRRQNKPEA